MPIKIPDHLPAKDILEREEIFVMTEDRAFHQDIRPLHIVILNLMPVKETAETQILRLLANTPLQLDIALLRMRTHESKNTSSAHLEAFYQTVEEIEGRYFDGMIVTGAPIEHLPFESVGYWPEFQGIMEWRSEHVTSTLFVCWAAMAGLYHQFGVPKHVLRDKTFGVFEHELERQSPLVRGFDDRFFVPHSRLAEVRREDLERRPELDILAASAEAGVYMVATKDGRQVFVTGHPEYELMTLHEEFERDQQRGLRTALPKHYYPEDNPSRRPSFNWRSHASLLISNWLNYYVYQETPYELGQAQRESNV
jgi:homoserine O-succinyltransferase